MKVTLTLLVVRVLKFQDPPALRLWQLLLIYVPIKIYLFSPLSKRKTPTRQLVKTSDKESFGIPESFLSL